MAIEYISIWGIVAFVGVILLFAMAKLWGRYRDRSKRDIFDTDRYH